jgi:hypothetical protein
MKAYPIANATKENPKMDPMTTAVQFVPPVPPVEEGIGVSTWPERVGDSVPAVVFVRFGRFVTGGIGGTFVLLAVKGGQDADFIQ